MIEIAICDDDLMFLESIDNKIQKIFDDKKEKCRLHKFPSGKQLIEAIDEIKFDIVFLDIDMPELSGLGVADYLGRISSRINIVFVTNRDDMVFEAIHSNPIRFIRKSHLNKELEEAILYLINKIAKETYIITFSNSKETCCFPIYDIWFLESKKHYVYFYVNDEVYKLRIKLSSCDEMLKDFGFIKTHGSYMVNIRRIKTIGTKKVILKNGVELPVSRSNAEKIKLLYAVEMEKYVNGIVI